jgi:hypothetical protein
MDERYVRLFRRPFTLLTSRHIYEGVYRVRRYPCTDVLTGCLLAIFRGVVLAYRAYKIYKWQAASNLLSVNVYLGNLV